MQGRSLFDDPEFVRLAQAYEKLSKPSPCTSASTADLGAGGQAGRLRTVHQADRVRPPPFRPQSVAHGPLSDPHAPYGRTMWGAGKCLCRNALPHMPHMPHLFARV